MIFFQIKTFVRYVYSHFEHCVLKMLIWTPAGERSDMLNI